MHPDCGQIPAIIILAFAGVGIILGLLFRCKDKDQ